MKPLTVWGGTILSLAMTIASWRGWIPFSLIETLGFVTGGICVYLTIWENIWNFPIGIANNLFFLILFLNSRLFADASLQIVYVLLGLQGWYYWLYGGRNRTTLTISYTPLRITAIVGVLIAVGTVALIPILRVAHGAMPWLDSLTTMLSLGAQYLLNRKGIENWYVWIIADILYIFLYLAQELQLTALLYAIFLGLCLAGLINWRRTLAQQEEPGGGGLEREPIQ